MTQINWQNFKCRYFSVLIVVFLCSCGNPLPPIDKSRVKDTFDINGGLWVNDEGASETSLRIYQQIFRDSGKVTIETIVLDTATLHQSYPFDKVIKVDIDKRVAFDSVPKEKRRQWDSCKRFIFHQIESAKYLEPIKDNFSFNRKTNGY